MNKFINPQIHLFSQPVKGKVEKSITSNTKGWIKFQGSYWSAKLYNSSQIGTISSGQLVKIVGREGITLLVIPA